RICIRDSVRGFLRGRAQTGLRTDHRLSLDWRRPYGHAPCARCRRSFAGVPCSREVLVWLDCHGCTWSAHVRPYCYVVARTMDTKILAGVVVGGSRARDDRVRLSHNALVSALTRRCTRRRKRTAGPSSAWTTTGTNLRVRKVKIYLDMSAEGPGTFRIGPRSNRQLCCISLETS